MQKESGKRLAGGKKVKKVSRLSLLQKYLVAVVVCLVIAVAAVAGWKSLFVRPDVQNRVPDQQDDPEQPTVEVLDYGEGIRPKADGERKSEDYYTVLILGRDTGGGGNTDTMLLASYDVTNQKATVMSIPRDTMVNVSWDVKKINSVYNVNGCGEKGIQALYKEIAQLVGFEPDYQVVVEWEAVGKLVDAIGGVYFDVPYTMDYHDPYQDLVIEQEKGYRLLTGDDAMQVIRWRKNDPGSPYGYTTGIGDSGRMSVQQDFLKAVIEQLMKPANMLNIGKIAKVFQESVETDLSFQEILWFGKAAVSGGLSVSNVEFLTMPWRGAEVYSRTESNRLGRYTELAYVLPIASELLDIVNNKLSPYADPFALKDLDIMSVNSDGSIRSTTGYVEDSQAAKPPVRMENSGNEESLTDENDQPDVPEEGEIIIISPEMGEVIPEFTNPGNMDSGAIDSGNADVDADEPGNEGTHTGDDPDAALPEESGEETVPPVTEPEIPAEPEGPNFSIIEPPPVA